MIPSSELAVWSCPYAPLTGNIAMAVMKQIGRDEKTRKGMKPPSANHAPSLRSSSRQTTGMRTPDDLVS